MESRPLTKRFKSMKQYEFLNNEDINTRIFTRKIGWLIVMAVHYRGSQKAKQSLNLIHKNWVSPNNESMETMANQ